MPYWFRVTHLDSLTGALVDVSGLYPAFYACKAKDYRRILSELSYTEVPPPNVAGIMSN